MAERVPVSSCESILEVHDHPYSVAAPVHPIFESGTYVIQVPKDQIYRVPPPENALIIEEHRNEGKKKESFCCSCSLCCFFSIAILIIIVAVVLALCFALLKPQNPRFQVQKLVVKNQLSGKSHSRPEYDITLQVHNPNGRSDISYQQGVISLLFKQQNIATGKFPSFHQKNKSSRDINTALESSNSKLPKDIESSMRSSKSKVNVSFSLEINVTARMKTSSFGTGNAKVLVKCNFTVDTLSKSTRILSQECQTHR
ncbi:hypothetical protein K2173_026795 [Erythroxylum novogranatense]|uniref:Late embryogenesis abundant protein LEA-2 subgroup domain-containing protein n=1 Tax=Erythroxylum novogranatense TaxID=1862640 RepID=A0AAV8U117_9ROSI|nr:hypothetical protein K2173_026795 [Erythroxylum novogranatense]